MTRFARAKGSKASNERIPEPATPWKDMKQQLMQKYQDKEDASKKSEVDERRTKTYESFLKEKEEEQAKKVQWAEFPGVEKKAVNRLKAERKIKKAVKGGLVSKMENGRKVGGSDELKEEDLDGSDDKEDENFLPLETKIEIKLEGDEQDNSEDGEGSGDDDAPEETSAKIKPLEPVVGKKKVGAKNGKLTISVNGTVAEKSDDKTSDDVLKKKYQAKLERRKRQKEKKKQKHLENGKGNGAAQNNKELQGKNKKPLEEMTEEERAKVEKRKQKLLAQKQRRKEFKEKKRAEESSAAKSKGANSKPPKNKSGKDHARRKPLPLQTKVTINGQEVTIAHYDGFPVKKEDYDRLVALEKEMRIKGVPRDEIKRAMQLERRRAEKALARMKKIACFNCRESGHNLSECPKLSGPRQEAASSGICFKCGSTEHTHFDCKVVRGDQYKFAQCFICKEQGHISRQCPDNHKGLYPNGGACRACGDVTHFKRDCPKFRAQQERNAVVGETLDGANVEGLEGESRGVGSEGQKGKVNKIVKF